MGTVTPNKRPACQFTLLEDLTETLVKEPITADQIIYAAMFGGAFSGIKPYDSTKVYSKTDHILYTNTDGSICILTPKHEGVTGTFNMDNWSVYNLLCACYLVLLFLLMFLTLVYFRLPVFHCY